MLSKIGNRPMSAYATVKFKNTVGQKTFKFPEMEVKVLWEGRIILFTHNGSGTRTASNRSMATREKQEDNRATPLKS